MCWVSECCAVKAHVSLQWERCVFEEALKLPSKSKCGKQVCACAAFGKGQRGETVNSTIYLTRQAFDKSSSLFQDNSILCTNAPAVCLRELGKQRQTEGDTNILNTTVSPSATTHWRGSQTLPTGNTHLLPGNTSDISNLHHHPPQWHLGLKIAHRLLSGFRMADIFSYAHKRDVSWVAGGFRWLKGDRCMHAGPGWVVNLGV